jgi:hypothetical protein
MSTKAGHANFYESANRQIFSAHSTIANPKMSQVCQSAKGKCIFFFMINPRIENPQISYLSLKIFTRMIHFF